MRRDEFMDSFFIHILFLLIPLYVANGGAMLAGILFPTPPIDGGKKLPDGQFILGKGKTWSGTIGGIILGTLMGLLIQLLIQPTFEMTGTALFYPLFAFLIATGAIVGDMVGSFIKRRLLLASGSASPILDQLDFVVGAYLLTYAFYHPPALEVLVVCAFTIVSHTLSNYLAFKIGFKKVPW